MLKKSTFFAGIALVIVGIGLIGGGIHFIKEQWAFFNQSVLTQGKIVDITSSRSKSTTTYYPQVSFESSDGETYTFSSTVGKSGSFDFTVGDSISVRYLEEKPQLAKIDGFWEMWAIPAILSGVGMILFLVGLGNCYNYVNKVKLRKELPRTGELLQLKSRVEERPSKSKTEYVVIAEWQNPKDSNMYRFTSERINYDPGSFLAERMVDVWIDPLNPKKRHFLDLAFLPEEA